MKAIESTQRLRLQNLREIHGRPERFGAPTSKFLVEYLQKSDLQIAPGKLTDIYQRVEPITDQLAEKIERAFSLPKGWLSTDHEFVFKLDPSALAAHSRLASLPQPVQEKLHALIEVLANDTAV